MVNKNKVVWSKACPIRPHDHLQSHVHLKQPKFMASFEYDPCPPNMSWLLGWEYGRIWRREVDAFNMKRHKVEKVKFIKNDYESWLQKRFQKRYQYC